MPQALSNIADHLDISNVRGIGFARLCINMDKFLVSVGVPKAWMVFNNIITDSDDEVGAIKSAGDEIVCL